MLNKLSIALVCLFLLISCSPRDLLSRRLATDLILASDEFRTQQQLTLQTGVLSNPAYISPESLVLQHHGWISATTVACPPGLAPPPCWDVLLTPSGVDTVRTLVPGADAEKSSLLIPAARRELLAISGISRQGNSADVEFLWKWVPSNEIGAAFYSADLRYKSTVGFRQYDDGWRILETSPRPSQPIADALKSAEPIP